MNTTVGGREVPEGRLLHSRCDQFVRIGSLRRLRFPLRCLHDLGLLLPRTLRNYSENAEKKHETIFEEWPIHEPEDRGTPPQTVRRPRLLHPTSNARTSDVP